MSSKKNTTTTTIPSVLLEDFYTIKTIELFVHTFWKRMIINQITDICIEENATIEMLTKECNKISKIVPTPDIINIYDEGLYWYNPENPKIVKKLGQYINIKLGQFRLAFNQIVFPNQISSKTLARWGDIFNNNSDIAKQFQQCCTSLFQVLTVKKEEDGNHNNNNNKLSNIKDITSDIMSKQDILYVYYDIYTHLFECYTPEKIQQAIIFDEKFFKHHPTISSTAEQNKMFAKYFHQLYQWSSYIINYWLELVQEKADEDKERKLMIEMVIKELKDVQYDNKPLYENTIVKNKDMIWKCPKDIVYDGLHAYLKQVWSNFGISLDKIYTLFKYNAESNPAPKWLDKMIKRVKKDVIDHLLSLLINDNKKDRVLHCIHYYNYVMDIKDSWIIDVINDQHEAAKKNGNIQDMKINPKEQDQDMKTVQHEQKSEQQVPAATAAVTTAPKRKLDEIQPNGKGDSHTNGKTTNGHTEDTSSSSSSKHNKIGHFSIEEVNQEIETCNRIYFISKKKSTSDKKIGECEWELDASTKTYEYNLIIKAESKDVLHAPSVLKCLKDLAKLTSDQGINTIVLNSKYYKKQGIKFDTQLKPWITSAFKNQNIKFILETIPEEDEMMD